MTRFLSMQGLLTEGITHYMYRGLETRLRKGPSTEPS